MKNKQYIRVYSLSIASIIADGGACPVGAVGLFESRICVRSRETEKIKYFYGSAFFFEEDSAEERIWRLEKAIDLMMDALKESDTFKADNYEVGNNLTGKWERTKL